MILRASVNRASSERRRQVLKPLNIPASAERPTFAGEHHCIGLLTLSDIGKDVRQFSVQFGVNGVEGFRPVQ